MAYDNQQRILKKDLKRDLATFNRQTKEGNDEVKMSKQEAIKFCKLLEGAKRIIQEKIAKA